MRYRCLPVFLSGCNTLLILCGPTYLHRLWCVLECFTFVKMGASLDRVVLMALKGTQHEALERFARFDVADATCFKPDEREHLLSVIEAGFGGYDGFNKIMRECFSTAHTSESSTRHRLRGALRLVRLAAGPAAEPSTSSAAGGEQGRVDVE